MKEVMTQEEQIKVNTHIQSLRGFTLRFSWIRENIMMRYAQGNINSEQYQRYNRLTYNAFQNKFKTI